MLAQSLLRATRPPSTNHWWNEVTFPEQYVLSRARNISGWRLRPLCEISAPLLVETRVDHSPSIYAPGLHELKAGADDVHAIR